MNALCAPERNQLVWLTLPAWQALLAQPWDAEAATVLQHWQRQQLPLVVAAQRPSTGPSTGPAALCLGLPAPTQWGRRKLALEVPLAAVARVADFPALAQVVKERDLGLGLGLGLDLHLGPHLHRFLDHMHALQVPVSVYGSFGWQHLTGKHYLRPGSDLDLRAAVPDAACAAAVAQALEALQCPVRVDGELVFPNGNAVAWREYLQGLRGAVSQVLVKRRSGAQLQPFEALA